MNLKQMRDEVSLIIQDDSYTAPTIDGYINQALLHACDLVAVPQLKVIDNVSTVVGQRYVNLSSVLGNFSGRLSLVKRIGAEVAIYPDLENFIQAHPESSDGHVSAVCLEGSILWYHAVPDEAEDLLLVYYKNPAIMVTDNDTTDAIPQSLHKKLLVHGACYMIFDQIEDGMEGQKVNTQAHYLISFFDERRATPTKSGIQEFREFIASRRKNHITSVWSA